MPPPGSQASPNAPTSAVHRIGCVSYLNAKPLIEGFDDRPDAAVTFDVPSRLLEDLEAGRVDIALCPVIDYFRSLLPLAIVPVGGIGSDGETFTVRLFSRIPLRDAKEIYADSDSHTSVALMRVLLDKLFDIRPRVIDYDAREQVAAHKLVEPPATMLLIGDKVVTDCPPADRYPHQLDLGQAWRDLTNLPFVFAVWMARRDARLGDLPAKLDAQRLANAKKLDAIADLYAPRHGWPADLARRYLGKLLRYDIGPVQFQAITLFARYAHQLGLIPPPRPIELLSAYSPGQT